MGKLILFALLVAGVVLFFKHQARKRVADESAADKDRPVEDMVRCARCGVNLPRSEAILSQGKTYCCEEHRRG